MISDIEIIPSRTGYQIVFVYCRTYTLLASRGLCSQSQCLNNEAYQALVHYLEDENVDFQLAPPSFHRMNASERAIHTLKNHTIVILCDIYPNFNLVLRSKLNPKLWQRLTTSMKISLLLLISIDFFQWYYMASNYMYLMNFGYNIIC